MTISSISYSSYQNAINNRKNSKDNTQIPEKQITFKSSITKHTLIRTKNSNMISSHVLKALGLTLMMVLGIKSANEIALDNDFKNIYDNRKHSIGIELYKDMSKYSKKMKKAYKRNPELVGNLMTSKVKQEHYCIHNTYETSDLEYSHNAVLLIEKYSQEHPELTDLYKKCLSNSYTPIYNCKPENEKELLDLVTQNPNMAEKILYQTGYKDSKNYDYDERYFPDKLLTELKKS